MSRRLFSLGVLLTLLVGCGRDAAPVPNKMDSLRRGDELFDQKQYVAAGAAYREALAADAVDGEVHLKLAKVYLALEDFRAGTTEVMAALDLMPQHREARAIAFSLLLGAGRFFDATTRAAAILEKEPEDIDALLAWANATASITSSALALTVLDEATRTGADYERTFRNLRPLVSPSSDASAEAAFRRAVRIDPQNTDARLALVNFLWATGRAGEGEESLRFVADRETEAGWTNRLLGDFYLRTGRPADGEKRLKRAAGMGDRDARIALVDYYIKEERDEAYEMLQAPDLNDGSTAMALRLAGVEWRTGRREAATQRIDGILSREPSNARALLFKTQFLIAAKNWTMALPVARAALAQDPLSRDAQSMLGEILFATGDLENAFAAYTEAIRLDPTNADLPPQLARLALLLGRGPDALRNAREAKRSRPNDRDATFTLAKALVLNGDYAAAERELATLTERDAASADVQALLGTVRAGRGNRSGARAAFTRSLQLSPKLWDAVAGLIQLDLDENSVQSARRRIDQAVAAQPDVRSLLLSARVSVAENDRERAEQTMRQALTLDPSSVEAAMSLADLLGRAQRNDEAARVMEQVLQRRPLSIDAQMALGRILENAGKLEEARARYERILSQDPRTARASSRLAAVYVEQGGNLDMALTLAVSAKQLLPRDADVSDTLGWVYTGKGATAQGLPHLQDAVRQVPDNPIYRYHLGAGYLRAGDRDRARAELARALAIKADFRGAAQARQLLADASR